MSVIAVYIHMQGDILYQTNLFFVIFKCLLLAQVKVNIFMQNVYLLVSIGFR